MGINYIFGDQSKTLFSATMLSSHPIKVYRHFNGWGCMRLIYLILSTVFGFLAIFLAFLTLYQYGTGLFITTLILGFISILCGYKYKKSVHKDNDLDNHKAEMSHEHEVLNYKLEHHDELLKYTIEINQILSNRYHFKINYRPKFQHNLQYDYNHVDYVFLKKGLRPDQAAKIIFDEVTSQGDDFNPNLIHEQFIKGKLPKFSGFYKAFFGSYKPSYRRVIGTFSIFIFAFLALYGLPIKYFKMGNFDNLFIPSTGWLAITDPLAWLLSTGIMWLLVKNQNVKIHLSRKYKGSTLYLMYFLLAVMIFFGLHIVLNLGLPKALNQIVGTDATAYFTVVKDTHEHTTHGKSGSFTPYCVNFQIPKIALMKNEYCLEKQQYDSLPASQPFKMQFNVISSVFGNRVIGYH